MIEAIIMIIIAYLVVAWVSHFEGSFFGSVLPSWLCVFCLYEKIKEKEVEK